MPNSHPRIILILSRDPSRDGHGGNHRSYQIVEDIYASCPGAEIISRNLTDFWKDPKKRRTQDKYISEISDRWKLFNNAVRLGCNPYRVLNHLMFQFADRYRSFPFDLQHYLEFLDWNSPIDLCLIDHTILIELANINRKRGIPTILCPQNLETFDEHALLADRKGNLPLFLLGFQRDLNSFMACDERLIISLPEAWLLEGLEIPVHYYPYLPVGDIFKELMEIRKRRLDKTIKKGVFLLLGTTGHSTTGHGFNWFLNNYRNNHLHDRLKIVVAGGDSQKFEKDFKDIPNIEFRGWVESEELATLLSSVQALLVPQLTGFGALTKIPEAICAGVPVIASEHSVQSMNELPGVRAVPNVWEEWDQAIQESFDEQTNIVSLSAYMEWEKKQPKPLNAIINQYCSNAFGFSQKEG